MHAGRCGKAKRGMWSQNLWTHLGLIFEAKMMMSGLIFGAVRAEQASQYHATQCVAMDLQGQRSAEPVAAMPAPRAADLRHRGGHPVIVGMEPHSRGTLEHIQDTLQSPAVRVVGARSVLCPPVLALGATGTAA